MLRLLFMMGVLQFFLREGKRRCAAFLHTVAKALEVSEILKLVGSQHHGIPWWSSPRVDGRRPAQLRARPFSVRQG